MNNQHATFNDITVHDLIMTSNFDREIEMTVEEYVGELRFTDTYMDSLELMIIAKILKIVIIVYEQVNNTWVYYTVAGNIDIDSDVEPDIIYLSFTNNDHYESLIFKEPCKLKHLRSYVFPVRDWSKPLKMKNNFQFDQSNASHNSDLKSKSTVSNSKAPKEPSYNEKSDKFDDEYEDELFAAESTEKFDEYCNTITKIVLQLGLNSKSGLKQPVVMTTIRDRRSDEVVNRAGQAEVHQIHAKGVWKYQTKTQIADIKKKMRSEGRLILPLMMLEKEKFDVEGKFEKVKSRIVVIGSLQKKIEKDLKAAPTASLQSFYLIIFIAAKRGIRLRAKDVTGAFLNAKLDDGEEEYVLLSKKIAKMAVQDDPSLKQYVLDDGTMIALLIMCLYGLQQSPRRWYITIVKVLLDLGFVRSEFCTCFFFKIDGEVMNFVILFVDDLLTAIEDEELYKALDAAMIREFEGVSSQDGNTLLYLGIVIEQIPGVSISLHQDGYIRKMMTAIHPEGLPVKIPVYTNPKATAYDVTAARFLKPKEQADPVKTTLMKSLAMTLMFVATRTRKDLLFMSSFFASIMCPEEEDIAAVKRAITYCYNTIDKKQIFYREGEIEFEAYSDASHNLFANARGQLCNILYGDKLSAPLEMTSNKESFVSDSSYESELNALKHMSDKANRSYLMMQEIGFKSIPRPITLWCDNEAAVNSSTVEHVVVQARTKMMNRILFKVHEGVTKGHVVPKWITGEECNADAGTKPLMGYKFHYISDRTFSRKPNNNNNNNNNSKNSNSEISEDDEKG